MLKEVVGRYPVFADIKEPTLSLGLHDTCSGLKVNPWIWIESSYTEHCSISRPSQALHVHATERTHNSSIGCTGLLVTEVLFSDEGTTDMRYTISRYDETARFREILRLSLGENPVLNRFDSLLLQFARNGYRLAEIEQRERIFEIIGALAHVLEEVRKMPK